MDNSKVKKKYEKPEIEKIDQPEPGTVAHAAGCTVSAALCSAVVCN